MIIFGHRGAKNRKPENTIASFQEAKKFTNAVELDVYRVQSGELVVIHDEPVNRTPDGLEAVCEMTYAEIQARMAPRGIEVPRLFDVLVAVGSSCLFNIELKNPGTGVAVGKLISNFIRHREEESWKETDFIVSSFNHFELLEFHKHSPSIRFGALIGHLPIDLAASPQTMGAYSIHPCVDFISQALVDDAHARGLQVYVYTVNTLIELERLRAMGVDGVFTDFPDRLK